MPNRRFFPLLTLAAAPLLLLACATAEKPPAAKPRPASVTGNAADMDSALAEAARGYTQVERNGERLFCRRERQTGSNLSSTTCITEVQLRQRVEDSKKIGEDMRQHGRRCTQGPGCGQ